MEEWKSEDGTRTRNDSHAGVEHTYTPDDSDLLESSSDGGSSANSYHEDIPDPVELDHPLPMMRGATVDAIREDENESGAILNRGEEDFNLQIRRDGASTVEVEKSMAVERAGDADASNGEWGLIDIDCSSLESGLSSSGHEHARKEKTERREALSRGGKLLNEDHALHGYLRLPFQNQPASKQAKTSPTSKAIPKRYSNDNKVSRGGEMEEWKSSEGGRIKTDAHADIGQPNMHNESNLRMSHHEGGGENSYNDDKPDPVVLDHLLRMRRMASDAREDIEDENGANSNRGEDDFAREDRLAEEGFDDNNASNSERSSTAIGCASRESGASSRVYRYARKEKYKREDALSPAGKLSDEARTPGGYLRIPFQDRLMSKENQASPSAEVICKRDSKERAGETVVRPSHHPSFMVHKEVPCKPIGRGWGLPLASLVDQKIEEALQGVAGVPELFQVFGHDRDLLPMIWEIVSLLVVSSIIYALWVYQGRSTRVVDLITVALSSTGAVGIIARAFSARNYCGVVFNGQLASGIVDLQVYSFGELDKSAIGLSGMYAKAFLLVASLPALVVLALASVIHIVRFGYNLVLPRGNNGTWVLGRGVIRFGTRLVVVPFIEKKVVRGGVGNKLSTIQWPGGASRSYYGDPMDDGSWALHFPGRRSFWDEMACDKVFVQFGCERRLVIQTGRRSLSFVIAARDEQGGLLLIPVEASAGVRVRITMPAFSEATGGVTILMGVIYPKGALMPGTLARDLDLDAEPFCLDISACGIGATWEGWAAMFHVLDGAGLGSVSDESTLWHSLSDMCFPSPAASWAAGFFGGNFNELHQQAMDGSVTIYTGVHERGKRCVTLTPADKTRRLAADYDVVVGVVARGQGFVRVPVHQPDGISVHSSFDGIRGRFVLIPGGFHAIWRSRFDGNVKGCERLRDCDECLLYNTREDGDHILGKRKTADNILHPRVFPAISGGEITEEKLMRSIDEVKEPLHLAGTEMSFSDVLLYSGAGSSRGGPTLIPATPSLTTN